jgi:hypothetical protein
MEGKTRAFIEEYFFHLFGRGRKRGLGLLAFWVWGPGFVFKGS